MESNSMELDDRDRDRYDFSPRKYEETCDSSDRVEKIYHTRRSGDIPTDIQNQDFCDYLTWAAQQFHTRKVRGFKPLPKKSYYFADEPALIQHLKKNNVVLSVKDGIPEHNHPSEDRISISEDPSQIMFVQLKEIVSGGHIRSSGVSSQDSKIYVTSPLLSKIQSALQDEDHPFRRLSSWPIERSFVYLDVSDFSMYHPGQELLIINSIVRIIQNDDMWAGPYCSAARRSVEGKICIGDGYIFVLKTAANAVYFAAHLASIIENLVARKWIPVEFHFRMGVHIGPVYCFWDPGRDNWNYIGDGINGGQRVLSAIGKETDNVLFISAEVRQAIQANSGKEHEGLMLSSLTNKGRKADKHGNLWRVYEVNHTALVPVDKLNLISVCPCPGREG